MVFVVNVSIRMNVIVILNRRDKMKIKEIRHMLPYETIELEEELSSPTGKHKIITEVACTNLYRYDDLEVQKISIGGINSYSAKHQLRLFVK